jgi:PAS domain-containing protein
VFRSIEEELEKVRKGEGRLFAAFETRTQSYAARNRETLDLNSRAGALAGYVREQSAILEKTEEMLNEVNERIMRTGVASSEGNKIGEMKGAVGRLQREIIEMDQKREIVSWELRRHLLKQKNGGKDDYL